MIEEIVLPDQGHTLACMIRQHLFDNGASFAACTVPHPLDTGLTVRLDCPGGPKECLLAALRDASEEVQAAIKVVKTHIAHDDACMQEEEDGARASR